MKKFEIQNILNLKKKYVRNLNFKKSLKKFKFQKVVENAQKIRLSRKMQGTKKFNMSNLPNPKAHS